MKKYLLFDLDGTLTDPKVGICTCVQYALSFFGIEEPDLDKLTPFIGPPLKDSFMEFYHMTEEQAEEAIKKYRERFRDKGIFENKIYKGIPAMLRELHAGGMELAVASSKPTVFVQRILEHFHIAKYFKVVVGSELDGSGSDKEEVVTEALRQLFGGGIVEKDKVYMIGDRHFDVEGAHRAGVESIGVTYGYGGMEELVQAKSDYIVRSVEELRRLLLREVKAQQGQAKVMRKLWKVFLPFLLFLLVRGIAADALRWLVFSAGGAPGEGFLSVRDDSGAVMRLTGNGAAFLSAFGFAAGGAAVACMGRRAVMDMREDVKLLHLKGRPGGSYVLLAAALLGLTFGMNLLLSLSGATAGSDSYQAVAESQYGAGLLVGLLCYGVISPLSEELLFRGIVYGHLRELLGPAAAVFFSAVLFGVYHGNLVQGIYAFVLGAFIAYAYEYFGEFFVPVVLHMLANLLVFCFSSTGVDLKWMESWPFCGISLACAAVSIVLLRRGKFFVCR